MILQVAIFLAGLAVLSWSADKFVYGASALARNIGISPMMIGLTIVAMGSSAPEIVVSAVASINGNPNTAVGNALGSNITNIGLVLGITALIKPLLVSSTTLKREFPLLLVINLIAVYFLYDGELSSQEGIILILLFIFVLAGMAWISLLVDKGDPLMNETSDEIPNAVETSHAVLWIGLGLVLLPVSAQFMVDSAVHIARYFGMSDLLIDLGHEDLSKQVILDVEESIRLLEALDQDMVEQGIDVPSVLADQPERLEDIYDQLQLVTTAVKQDIATVLSMEIPREAAGDND